MTKASKGFPQVTFTSTVGLEDEGPFTTFKEALENFCRRIREEKMGLQVLETACWITRRSPYGTEAPLCFYNARDFGYQTGLLAGTNGQFQHDAAEPDPELVSQLYFAASMAGGDAQEFIERRMSAA